jgi:hypothetical protein
VDQEKYYAFPVEDVDKAQANVNFMDQAVKQAGYGFKDTADAYIAGLYAEAGNPITTAAINSVNAIAALQTMAQYLDEASVPTEGRWVVIPPWVKTKLVLAKAFVENTTNDALDNGRISRCCGFDVRMSNNVYNNATTWQVLAGTNQAISFAQQLLKTEALRADAAFADHVRGLMVYGAKVVHPEALACFPMTVAAEP